MAKSYKVYPAYIKGSREEVAAIEDKFVRIWARLKTSRTGAINEVFLAGLEALQDAGDRTAMDKLAVHVQGVRAQKATTAMLEELYENLPFEKFVEVCGEIGVDPHEFSQTYTISLPTVSSKRVAMERWLKKYLSDGLVRSVDSVKKAAQDAGVVESETDWNTLTVYASTLGYSGNAPRGYWRMKKVEVE